MAEKEPWAQPHEYVPGPRSWCAVCGYGVTQAVHEQLEGQTTVDGQIEALS